jgi:4-amino-4-deoxy-L-arabinose transferase-like glycosyltransferase
VFLVTHNDPFFGDAISSISRAGLRIFESNFKEFSYPENLDPGHPLTIPVAHALCWKILGKHLWVSHLFNLVWSMLIIIKMVQWGKQYGNTTAALIGAIWLLITPLFLAQTVNPNLHLALTYFVLSLAYALVYGHRVQQVVFSALIVITHLQGLYYLVPLWLWWLARSDGKPIAGKIVHAAVRLIIPGVLFGLWVWYHYRTTGWGLSSPDYAGHRGFPGFKRFIINLIMADWRMVDYGQIALFIIPLLSILRGKLRWSWSHPVVLFLFVYLFNGLAIAATTKTGPMHRYLLPCLPFIVLANVELLPTWKPRLWLTVSIVLISGHWWFYPGKIMGDATLAYRSVFPLLEEAKEDFGHEPFHSYAPLGIPSATRKLNGDSTDIQHLYNTNIDNVNYVIKSNISGDFSHAEIAELESNWPSKTYEKGYVYLEVYSNPERVSQPITGPGRKVGKLESWIIRLKHKIKGKDSV